MSRPEWASARVADLPEDRRAVLVARTAENIAQSIRYLLIVGEGMLPEYVRDECEDELNVFTALAEYFRDGDPIDD